MNRAKQASLLRSTRKIHRQTGILLFLFFIVIGTTGILLGWKKNVDFLQHPTQQGVSMDVKDWLSMDSLAILASNELKAKKGIDISTKIDKIDARPSKGIVKVIYKDHYYSVQLDASTGVVLSFEYRTSDFIEHLHEGTFADKLLGLPSGIFKLVYTSVMGSALLIFCATGFWLWYGPRLMRIQGRSKD